MPADAAALARRCAATMYADDAASHAAGIDIVEVGPGRATVTMRVRSDMVNGHAICHGGHLFLLADTAFALACNTYDVVTVAQACDIVFVTPARCDDVLVASALERLRSGRTGVYDVTVRRGDEVVAEFRGRSRTTGAPILPAEGVPS